MDFSLKDHQKLVRDTVRQFMEAEVRPFVKEWEKAEKFPAEAIKKLGEMGCCGMLVTGKSGTDGTFSDIWSDVTRLARKMMGSVSERGKLPVCPLSPLLRHSGSCQSSCRLPVSVIKIAV